MADKSIGELVPAEQIKAADLFPLEQDGAAKRLPGQVLLNWLVAAADGHGGISGIQKTGSSGLVDTYRITLADKTFFDLQITNGKGISSFQKSKTAGLVDTYTFTFNDGTAQDIQVTNGNGISGIRKTGTAGLVDTYRITFTDGGTQDIQVTNGRSITGVTLEGTSGLTKTYKITFNDGPSTTFAVTDGAKGDKGDNAYLWIRYASQMPTNESHSMGTVPDRFMGVYWGKLAVAPTDWKLYTWYQIKGEKGDTGEAATLTGRSTTYMVSDSGTIVPSGSWLSEIPNVPQGKYLWTRTVLTFNTGTPVTSYSIARMGLDGTGSVSAVNGKSPDSTGNVKLTAADINAADGQSIDANLEAKADKTATVTVTLTAAGWSGGFQTVGADGVTTEGDVLVSPTPESMTAYLRAGIWCAALQTGALRFGCRVTPTEAIQVSVKPLGV